MAEANEDTSPKDDGRKEDVDVVEDEKNDPVVEDTTDKSTPSAQIVEEEEDWLDILGNGQIKKKVRLLSAYVQPLITSNFRH